MATHSSILAWENFMERGAWWATVHRVTKNWIRLRGLTHTHTHTHTHVYVTLVVKNLSANAGDIRDVSSISGLGRSPGGRHDDPSHSNILAWKIPWAEKPGGLWSRGCKELDMTEQLTLPLFPLLLASHQCFP